MSRPKVLLIGDSISMGYTPGVIEQMADRADVVRIDKNGGTSRNCKENLAGWIERLAPTIVHFNCGLHDIAIDAETTTNRVPMDEYERNLRDMAAWLQENTEARLIWARTTPVIYERHHAVKGFDRYEKDVQAYNAVADRVMGEAGIPVNDLYAVIEGAGTEACIKPDGVHMTEKGNAVLVEAVIAALDAAIGQQTSQG